MAVLLEYLSLQNFFVFIVLAFVLGIFSVS